MFEVRRVWMSLLVLLAMVHVSAAAPRRVDFSGTWELSVEESDQIQAGSRQPGVTMVVGQSGQEIRIVQTVHAPSGDQEARYTYVADGRPRSLAVFGRKRVATARWEAGKLVVTIRQDSPPGVTPPESNFRETWELAPAQNTLTLLWESLDGKDGFQPSRFVFKMSSFKTNSP